MQTGQLWRLAPALFHTPPKLQVWAPGGPGARWDCSLEHRCLGLHSALVNKERVPSTHTAQPGSPGWALSPPSPLLSQVKTQLQAQTVAEMAVGHQHHHQVGLSLPRAPWAGWAPGRARGCPVTLCPLPTERPGRHGDHLAAAGPGRSVAGCGRGCAPSHGWLSCPAGHLRLCQGLGAGATGEGPGTHTHRSEEGHLPPFSLSAWA